MTLHNIEKLNTFLLDLKRIYKMRLLVTVSVGNEVVTNSLAFIKSDIQIDKLRDNEKKNVDHEKVINCIFI